MQEIYKKIWKGFGFSFICGAFAVSGCVCKGGERKAVQ